MLLSELELDPQDTEVLISIGTIMVDLEKIDYAAHCFLKVTEIQPENAVNYILLGQVLAIRGEYNDALQLFEYAIELDAHNKTAIKNAVLVRLAMKQWSKAFKTANLFQQPDIKMAALRRYAQVRKIGKAIKDIPKLLPRWGRKKMTK